VEAKPSDMAIYGILVLYLGAYSSTLARHICILE